MLWTGLHCLCCNFIAEVGYFIFQMQYLMIKLFVAMKFLVQVLKKKCFFIFLFFF